MHSVIIAQLINPWTYLSNEYLNLNQIILSVAVSGSVFLLSFFKKCLKSVCENFQNFYT